MDDYYKILGIESNSSIDDIKKAFKILALKYHPDKNGGDDIKFKKINEAYSALLDPNKNKTIPEQKKCNDIIRSI